MNTHALTFVYLIRRKGQTEVEVKTDRHLGGIFDVETWLRLLKKVGFEIEQIALKSYDFPTFICLKPLECKF